MLADALRDSARYPAVWIAGAAYGAIDAAQVALSLRGETFVSVRLMVLAYLVLPFLLAGAYGVLRAEEPSLRRFATDGVANYFRVLLPALVVGFGAALVLLVLLAPLAAFGGVPPNLAALAALALLVPVAFLLSLYDTAAVFEELGVFASLRRSVALVLAHPGAVALVLLSVLAILFLFGMVLLVGWTALLFDRLEPLASMPPADLSTFGPEQFAELLGPSGIALSALCYAVFVAVAFVLVTTYKARLYRSVADATPPVQQGVYDEKGRWYKY